MAVLQLSTGTVKSRLSRVYAAEDGDVEWVHSDGSIDTIGHGHGHDVIADPQTGWVSWVQGSAERHPELVVYDTSKPGVLARLPLAYGGPRAETLDEGSEPVAIDNGAVYYAAQDGDYRWDVTAGSNPEKVTDAGTFLLDRHSGVQIIRPYDTTNGYGHVVIQRPGASDLPIDDDGYPRLSPDGRYLLTVSMSLGDRSGHVRLYDTHTGQQVATGMPNYMRIDTAAFDEDGNIVVAATARPASPPHTTPDGIWLGFIDGPLDLINCRTVDATCTTTGADIAPGLVLLPAGL